MALIDDSIAAYLGRRGSGNDYEDESSNRNHAAIWTDSLSPFAKPEWEFDTDLERDVLVFPGNASGRASNYQQRAPHAVAFEDVVPQSGEFSIAIWINGEFTVNAPYIGSTRVVTSRGWELQIDNVRRPRFFVRGESGTGSQWADNSDRVIANEWNSVIVNASIIANNVDIYVNGVEPTGYFATLDFTTTGTDFTSHWNRMHIGGTAPSANNFHSGGPPGRILGPMIFPRLLTAGEIAELQTPPELPSVGVAAFSGIGRTRRLGT